MGLSPAERSQIIWPDSYGYVLQVGPLGSRADTLLYNRQTGEVSTGMVGTHKPCFLGTLEEFAERVESDYGNRIAATFGEALATCERRRAEYRNLVVFLRSLPSLEPTQDDI